MKELALLCSLKQLALNHEFFFAAASYQKYYLKISVDCTALFLPPSSAHEPYVEEKNQSFYCKSVWDKFFVSSELIDFMWRHWAEIW